MICGPRSLGLPEPSKTRPTMSSDTPSCWERPRNRTRAPWTSRPTVPSKTWTTACSVEMSRTWPRRRRPPAVSISTSSPNLTSATFSTMTSGPTMFDTVWYSLRMGPLNPGPEELRERRFERGRGFGEPRLVLGEELHLGDALALGQAEDLVEIDAVLDGLEGRRGGTGGWPGASGTACGGTCRCPGDGRRSGGGSPRGWTGPTPGRAGPSTTGTRRRPGARSRGARSRARAGAWPPGSGRRSPRRRGRPGTSGCCPCRANS